MNHNGYGRITAYIIIHTRESGFRGEWIKWDKGRREIGGNCALEMLLRKIDVNVILEGEYTFIKPREVDWNLE